METKELHFMGCLANVDSSILYLNDILKNGFKIDAINIREFDQLLRILTGSGMRFEYGHYARENLVYCIHNVIPDESNKSDLDHFHILVNKFEQEVSYNYLDSLIRSMKLFNEGNVCVTRHYYFYIEEIPKLVSSSGKIAPVMDHTDFKLEKKSNFRFEKVS